MLSLVLSLAFLDGEALFVAPDGFVEPIVRLLAFIGCLPAVAERSHCREVVLDELGVAADGHLSGAVHAEEAIADGLFVACEHHLDSCWIILLLVELRRHCDECAAAPSMQRVNVREDATARKSLQRSGAVVVNLEAIVKHDCCTNGLAPQLLRSTRCNDHRARSCDECAIHALRSAIELRSVRRRESGLDADLLVEVRELSGEELAATIRVHLRWIHSELRVDLLDDLLNLAGCLVLGLERLQPDEVAVLVEHDERVASAAERLLRDGTVKIRMQALQATSGSILLRHLRLERKERCLALLAALAVDAGTKD